MKLTGQRRYSEIANLMDNSVALDKDLVECGQVFKKVLFEDKKNYEALLFVGPMSKIKLHQHVRENEEYKDLDSQKTETCLIGGWHYLENESENKWLLVRAHKFR